MCSKDKNDAGFTMIELAIVLVVIAALVVGVMYGVAMVKNGRVAGFIGEVSEYRTGVAAFITRYEDLPGDSVMVVNDETLKLSVLDAGNGDGIIGSRMSESNYLEKESYEFFKHLSAAGLISFSSKAPSDGKNLESVDSIIIGQTYPGTRLSPSYFLYINSNDAYGLFDSKNRLSVFNKKDMVDGMDGDLMRIVQSKFDTTTVLSEFAND